MTSTHLKNLNDSKNFLYCFLLFFIIGLKTYSQDNGKTIVLKKILQTIEMQHKVTFNYLDDEIVIFRIIPPNDGLSLQQKLAYITLKTKLNFQFVSNNYITISSYKKIDKPLCGYVIDQVTLEVISGAIIGYKGTSFATISNEKGYFELPNKNFNEVEISHLNYGKTTLKTEELNTQNCPKIILKPKINELKEVVTTSILTKGIAKNTDGSFEIKPKKFGILPGLTEADVFLTMQNLPGINSADESISNINVRGGTHDQNLFLWNGIRIFQTGHFFGLISALNPNLANSIKIYKNGSPAFYGESASSSIDVTTYSNDTLHLNSIGFNLLNADFNASCKLGKKTSFTVSARRSYTDVLNSPTYRNYNNKIFQNTVVTSITNNENALYETDEKFFFYDATMQFHQKIGNRSELFVDAITISNKLNLIQEKNENASTISRKSTLEHKTLGTGFFLKTRWNAKNITTFNFYTSHYKVTSENESMENNQILNQENSILDIGLKIKLIHNINKNNSLHFGYQYNETGVSNFDAINTPEFLRKIKDVLNIHALIVESTYNSENNKFNSTLGIRQNYIEEFKMYQFEPRLQLDYSLSNYLKIETLTEIKSQTSSQIIDLQKDFLGIEKHRWVLANNEDYPVIKQKQASIGMTYKKNNWLFSIDNFYKKVSGVNSKSQGFQNQLEFIKLIGSYNSYGSEILLQKQFRKITSWLTYTYNINNYEFEKFSPSKFPNNYEIQHNLNFGIIYDYNNLKIAFGTHWHSGKPITKPLNSSPVYNTNNQPEILYEKPNSSRLKDYLQLNFSAGYTFSFIKKTKLQFGVAIQNLANKKNIVNQYYRLNTNNNNIEKVNAYSLQCTPNAYFRVYF